MLIMLMFTAIIGCLFYWFNHRVLSLQGYVEPNSETRIKLHYFPGSPTPFHDVLRIQVAHYDPDTIQFSGAATYPNVKLSLPRLHDLDDVLVCELIETAIKIVDERLKLLTPIDVETVSYLGAHSKPFLRHPAQHFPAICSSYVEDYFRQGMNKVGLCVYVQRGKKIISSSN